MIISLRVTQRYYLLRTAVYEPYIIIVDFVHAERALIDRLTLSCANFQFQSS